MRMIISTVLAAGALVTTTPRAGAQAAEDTRPTVAIMPFTNGAIGAAHGELEPLRKGIADMLITELSGNPRIRVIERSQLDRLLEEQKLGQGNQVDPETAVRIGRVLGARHMIFGTFVTDFRGNMRLDVRAVDVETSRIEYTETVTDKTDNFMALISRIAEKANTGMRLPEMPRQARDASSDRGRRMPFQVAMLYSRAIAEEDRGNTAGAVQLYRAVIEKFPEYEPAERALKKLRSSGSE